MDTVAMQKRLVLRFVADKSVCRRHYSNCDACLVFALHSAATIGSGMARVDSIYT